MLLDSEKITTLGRLLRELFHELDVNGIPYCVLRNHEQLPDYTNNDVDLMVPLKFFEQYMEILCRATKSIDASLVNISSRFGFQQTFHYPLKSSKLIQIDCHGNINYYGQKYINEEVVLQTRTWDHRGFWIASPGSEAAVSLMKEYILFGKVKDKGKGKTKKRITELAKEDPENFLNSLGRSLGRNTSEFILDCALEENWNRLESKVGYVRSKLLIRSVFQNPFSMISNLFGFIWGHLFDEVLFPNSLFLCLVGPDGSGKSSIIEALLLDDLPFESTNLYHCHFRILPPLRFYYNGLATLLRLKKVKEPTPAEAAQSLDDKPLGALRAMITVLYYTFEYLLGHLIILRGKTQRKLIIFDRYFYDYMTSPRFKRVPRFLLQAILRIIPKPDLVIYLEGDPEIIHKRKLELSYTTLLALQDGYHRIVNTLLNGYICRSDGLFADTLGDVKSLIIKRLNDRSLVKLHKVYKGINGELQ